MTVFFARLILFLMGVGLPWLSYADVSAWEMMPHDSTITFIGTLNDATISGQFKSFSGEVEFDPNHLDQSHARIIVDTDSLSTSYVDIAKTLKTSDWLDVKIFPQAIFQSTHFKRIRENTYEAEGMLTIRDQTKPITITFTQELLPNQRVRVKGSMELKRIPYGIGRGEWRNTSVVADAVEIRFEIIAHRK